MGFESLELRQLLSVDLTQEIGNLVDGGTASGSQTVNNVTLGNFLSADSVTVTLSDFSSQGSGDWTGTVSVTAQTASISIGSELTGTITGLSGSYALNDQLLDQGTYSLTLSSLTASVPDVLSTTLSNVGLGYDPSGSSSQSLATIGSLNAQIIPFGNTQVALNDLDILEDGFSLGSGTVSAGSFTVGGLVSVDNPSLTFTDLAYTDGSSPSLTGTISVSGGAATLFPGQTAFTAVVDGFNGTYNFSTDALSLSATDVDVTIG